MNYTLDTNALTALLTGRGAVEERFNAALYRQDEVSLNAVSYFEMKRGLYLPRFERRLAQFETFVRGYETLPLNFLALDAAVKIYRNLRASGTLLEDADIFVAAIAIANDATLVTRNTRHFERIEGLRLENWEDA